MKKDIFFLKNYKKENTEAAPSLKCILFNVMHFNSNKNFGLLYAGGGIGVFQKFLIK